MFNVNFKSTLLRFSHSILARMISGSIPMRKDREGRIFLDRDPNIFGFVLEYLRSSKVRFNSVYASFLHIIISLKNNVMHDYIIHYYVIDKIML